MAKNEKNDFPINFGERSEPEIYFVFLWRLLHLFAFINHPVFEKNTNFNFLQKTKVLGREYWISGENLEYRGRT